MSLRCIMLFMVLMTEYSEGFTLVQPDMSLTKLERRTARIECIMEGLNIKDEHVHWYRIEENKSPEWILYYKSSSNYRNGEKFKNGFSAGKNYEKNSCILTLTNPLAKESATYFCGVFDNFVYMVFGSGTKLTVTNTRTVKAPQATILSTSKERIERTGQVIYMCLLDNFYPDVIKVTWRKEGSTEELLSEQGEMMLDDKIQTYSLTSWITVSKNELGERFFCRYKHEGNTHPNLWGEISTTGPQPKKEDRSDKNSILIDTRENDKTCVKIYNNSTDYPESPFKATTYRAAYLTYILMLLKSVLYCPIMIFTYKATA